MSATRITPLEPPYEDSLAAAFEKIMPPGMAPLKLFRTQAHNPRVLHRMVASNLLDKGSISVRDRELVILRTCARCGSEYEWGVHVTLFSERAKLSAADIQATLSNDQEWSGLSAQDIMLLKTVDELHDTSTISDTLWAELAQQFATAQILEVITLIGNYHAVSLITNAVGVELESFAARFESAQEKAI